MSSTLWETVIGILASLGGGGAIILGLSHWLGKMWANHVAEQLKASNSQDLERIKADFVRELESYKIQLKKSEFIFQKQFEAASAIVALKRDILPSYSEPYMDYYVACEYIASSFETIEKQLDGYLALHGAILPDEAKEILVSSLADVGTFKFEVDHEGASSNALDAADNLLKNLGRVEELMINLVRDQSKL